MVLKWGILGAGKISNEFARAILFHADENRITAVAARDLSRAKEFANTYGIDRAYGNYESLGKDPDVDIVYVANLNPQHLESCKLMLESGKHVLCEKPLAMNEKQARQLIDLARSKKLFFMEAVWSRCFPVYERLRNIIDSGEIGEIKYVGMTFGRPLNHIERMNEKELGGGTILDLGVYCLQFQQFIYRGQKPFKILASGHLNKYGTDESTSAVLLYPGGKTAVLTTSAVTQHPNIGFVVGTKGTLRIPNFWRATEIITSTKTEVFELPQSKFNSERASGLSYEVEEVNRCIKQGLLESPKIPLDETLHLAQLMDEVRRQVGVVYAQDLQ